MVKRRFSLLDEKEKGILVLKEDGEYVFSHYKMGEMITVEIGVIEDEAKEDEIALISQKGKSYLIRRWRDIWTLLSPDSNNTEILIFRERNIRNKILGKRRK